MKKFEADVEKDRDLSIVRLSGELDANTAVSADDALQSAITKDCKGLVIDCSELEYISSAGLGVVLATMHACNHNSIKLAFFGLQPKIMNVFSILGVEKIVSIASTEEEACKLVGGS
ncbi:STAS domain-containing protein [Pontibacter locisalis]|uniref:Anti-sigma factor antagonist n=1 Tax=Pontibacter locisalis TaxID=1719035 RepID=A0ABW5IND9_9BACT